MFTEYDNQNPFAKIIAGEIPCNKVYEDEHILSFYDIQPAAPVHVLVIPKKAYLSFQDFMGRASKEEVSHFFSGIAKVTEKLDVVKSGYRLITNHGEDSGQTVGHFHVHILAKKQFKDL